MKVHADNRVKSDRQASEGRGGSAAIAGDIQAPDAVHLPKIAHHLGQGRVLPDSQAAPVQRKPNLTGMPDGLKAGMEGLSGFSLDSVRVHFNSGKPGQLQAHAYAQGTNIYVAPGQEKHLPHEAWHTVQQMQGRVKPTQRLDGKTSINDDGGLEREADAMGSKALRGGASPAGSGPSAKAIAAPIAQRKLRILNSKAGKTNPQDYDGKNVAGIRAAVTPYLKKYSKEYADQIVAALENLARKGSATHATWAQAVSAVAPIEAPDLKNVGVGPGKIGEVASEKAPFSYLAAGQVKDHIGDNFDEGVLPWTHNSSPAGLLGIMLTGVMAPGVEKSVNFRYDIDSRYHQGVTIVMKRGLYACFKGEKAWIEDLYSQHTALGKADAEAVGEGGRKRAVNTDYEKPFLQALAQQSNFRSKQVGDKSGTLGSGKKVPIIASHNPQLRIPSVIGINHIDFIILSKAAWDQLSGLIMVSSNHGPAIEGAKAFSQKSSQKAAMPKLGNMDGVIANLKKLAGEGGIYVNNEKVTWAHEAGRLTERSEPQKRGLKAASEAGLEAGEGFGASEIGENNSPKALGMESFEQFQAIYYAKLASRDNETGKVAANILKGKKPPHLYRPEVQGLIHQNNCLINAISRAARNNANATLEELTLIRAALNNVGQMMATDPLTMDTIRQTLGIVGRGLNVLYPVGTPNVQDEIIAGNNPITIYHTGDDHFQHDRPAGVRYADSPPEVEAQAQGQAQPAAQG